MVVSILSAVSLSFQAAQPLRDADRSKPLRGGSSTVYRSVLGMPVRRSAVSGIAAACAATALTAGALGLAPTAGATTPAAAQPGHATAVDLRAGLRVSLLDKAVEAPLNVALNDV